MKTMKDNQIKKPTFFEAAKEIKDMLIQINSTSGLEIKHIPILFLTAVPKDTIIDGDNNYNAAHIMVYDHLPYWYEILNIKGDKQNVNTTKA